MKVFVSEFVLVTPHKLSKTCINPAQFFRELDYFQSVDFENGQCFTAVELPPCMQMPPAHLKNMNAKVITYSVKENDPGTCYHNQYDWFLQEDGTKCKRSKNLRIEDVCRNLQVLDVKTRFV